MSDNVISGVSKTKLKQIFHPKGNVLHALKASESSFLEFGEAYFSTINTNDIKGWKKHTKMTMNLVVPVGEIKFYFYNDERGERASVVINSENYYRLTVAPNIWMAFEGIGQTLNMILNIASIEHDSDEAVNVPLTTYALR